MEIAYLYLLALLLLGSWLALVLGEFGYFSLVKLAILTAIAVTGGVFLERKVVGATSITWSWDIVGVLPALFLAAALFTPPFEWVLGGSDPGVYISTAASIARSGSIAITDPDLAALSSSVRAALFRSGLRHDGFYIVDPARGEVEPHGFHLYPTVLAVAYSFGGIWGSLWITPLIALLALIGFYLLVRRLCGPTVAAFAAVLLAANPAVIWFARYQAAENLVQLWLYGGLLAFVLMLDRHSRSLGVLSGVALGAVHLTKIEEVALPVALAAFFAYQWIVRNWHAEYEFFGVSYVVLLVHAILHARFLAEAYTFALVNELLLQRMSGGGLIGLLLLVVAVVIGLSVGRDQLRRAFACRAWTDFAPAVGSLGILLLAGYAYYIRPRFGGTSEPLATLSPGDLYAWASRASFVILGWYVSPLALLLAPLGYAIAILRARSTRSAVVLMLVFLGILLQLEEGRIRPLHFWAARRDLTVVFPAFAIFSSYLLWRLQLALRKRWPEAVIPSALGAVMLISCLGGWLPFRDHVEFRGAVDQIGQIAAAIPPGSVLLFDDSHAGHSLATPLQYIWNRPSFVLWPGADDDNHTAEAIAEWLGQGRSVYWVRAQTERLPQDRGVYETVTRPPPPVERWGYRKVLVASPAIDLPMALATIARRPDTVERLHYDLKVYQIVPNGDQPGPTTR